MKVDRAGQVWTWTHFSRPHKSQCWLVLSTTESQSPRLAQRDLVHLVLWLDVPSFESMEGEVDELYESIRTPWGTGNFTSWKRVT